MIPVFLNQWVKEWRSPYLTLVFIVLTISAVLMFANLGTDEDITVLVYHDETTSESEAMIWIDHLNQPNDELQFELDEEETVLSELERGREDVVLQLMEDDYRLITTAPNPSVIMVEAHTDQVFTEQLTYDQLDESELSAFLEKPPLSTVVTDAKGEELIEYRMDLQLLFGFTMFLSIFTIGFKMNSIVEDKTNGIWDRVILTPLRATGVYLGHLTFSFLIGLMQIIAIFLLFHYVFNIDLGNRFGELVVVSAVFTLSIVALSMLIAGIVKRPEQFEIIYPTLVPIMPLLSGVYMPPGSITSPIILTLAEFIPITHGMEAMIGVSMYDYSLDQVLMPLAKLLLMIVIFVGIGINLMERRK